MLKDNEKFFDGIISKYFTGREQLYIGDLDFKFANEFYVINAEIKTLDRYGKFPQERWLKMAQARDLSATAGLVDPMGRKHSSYLFEDHKHAKDPFVVIVPFKTLTGKEQSVRDYLNIDAAKMVYVKKDDQLCKVLDKFNLGQTPKKSLVCVPPF